MGYTLIHHQDAIPSMPGALERRKNKAQGVRREEEKSTYLKPDTRQLMVDFGNYTRLKNSCKSFITVTFTSNDVFSSKSNSSKNIIL